MKNTLIILCLFALCNVFVLAQRNTVTDEKKNSDSSAENSVLKNDIQAIKEFPRLSKLPPKPKGNKLEAEKIKKLDDDDDDDDEHIKDFEFFGGISFQRNDTEQFSELSSFGGLSPSQVRSNFNASDSQLDQGFDRAFGAARDTVGFNISATYYVSKNVGIVGDFAYHKKEQTRSISSNGIFFEDFATSNRKTYSFLFGPQAKFRRSKRVQPFVRVMGGFVKQENTTGLFFNNPGGTDPGGSNQPIETLRLVDEKTNFALAFGGGIDVKVQKYFAIRIFQFDYIPNFMSDRDATLTAPAINGTSGASLGRTSFDSSRRDSFRFSFGVVFRK